MQNSNNGRIRERDLNVPALCAARSKPGGYITTTDLIAELTNELKPIGEDAEIAPNRKDTKFSQKVRNLISHKAATGNIIAEGYAEHIDDGIRITDDGRAYLTRQGF